MEYSISQDTATGAVNFDKLSAEIIASGSVNPLNGLASSGDILHIEGVLVDQAGLDAVIQAHVAVALSDLKATRVLEIDARTREIIADGFAFDGQQFSLSAQAQTNWLGLISLQSMFTWPVNVTTNANTEYALAQANINAFVGTGCATIADAIGSGRALKISVNAATNQTELDAVVDSR